MLILSATMIMAGRIADIYGRRATLYSGMIIFAVASLGAGLAPTVHWLIGFRLLQGLGVAILYTVPVAIISNLFPSHQRGRATGILFGLGGSGLAVGPVLGGFIVSALSWRWIFLVNPPIIILSFILCMKNLNESKSTEHGSAIDWPGFILLLIALPTIIFTTVQGSNWGWLSAPTLSLYALALLCLGLFYWVENKSASPIIPFKLFANPLFLTGMSASFALAFFYTVAFFLMPLFLHNIKHLSSDEIGFALLPVTAMFTLLSPWVGHRVDKYGPKILLLTGFVLFALSALMQVYFSSHTPLWFILLAFLLFGIGWACILSPSFTTALSSVPESISGVAMGALGSLHNFGGALGLALGTIIYQAQSRDALTADVARHHLTSGHWLGHAIANPDHAVNIIQQNTGLGVEAAAALFQHFFMRGYASAMWLLVAISLLALCKVMLGLKRH